MRGAGSGGEPLLRDDVVEIVRNIKAGTTLPYLILVSNWSHMSEHKYLQLRDAGVDQFSVSLDFPDERHDGFRMYPGLYAHLQDLVPRLAALGHDDIVLNSCIHSENVAEINRMADKGLRMSCPTIPSSRCWKSCARLRSVTSMDTPMTPSTTPAASRWGT